MQVVWSIFKQFLQEKSTYPQYVDLGRSYWMKAFNGSFELDCSIDKDTDDCVDFETNFKASSNQQIKSEVITQYEKDDKTLKLSRGYSAVDGNGQAICYVKVPGAFGVGVGRYLMGGYGISADYHPDDFVTCFVEDKDRNIAMMVALAMNPAATSPVSDATIQAMGILPGINKAFPNYPLVQSYTDDEQIIDNQGWYFWPLATGNGLAPVGEVEINPIGGYGYAPSGLYLKIIYHRPAGIIAGSIRLNIDWGRKDA